MKKELICSFILILFFIPIINAYYLDESLNIKNFEFIVEEVPPEILNGILLNDIVTIQDMLSAYQQYKRNEVTLSYFLDRLQRWIILMFPSEEEPPEDPTNESGDYDWLFVDNADRIINWSYAGIPGGVPHRTNICMTLGLAGQESSYVQDVTHTDINNAIAACPENQVVYLNTGTYTLSSYIDFYSIKGVTLRGAGAGNTIINSLASSDAVRMGASTLSSAPRYAVSGDVAKGATSLTLTSTPPAACQVGGLMVLDELAGTGVYRTTLSLTRPYSVVFRVTGVSGNIVSFTPPIPLGFSSANSPTARFGSYAGVTSLCGIEDMSISSSGQTVVRFFEADRCWMKGIDGTAAGLNDDGLVHLSRSVQCEVSRNYIHDVAGWPSQDNGYGIYSFLENSFSLIEDNIVHRTATSFNSGASGNVWGYNFFADIFRDWGGGVQPQYPEMGLCHFSFPVMNLYEGNSANVVESDQSHGNAHHYMFFRNHFHGIGYEPPGSTLARRWLFWLGAECLDFTMVGNILGDPSWTPTEYDLVTESIGTRAVYKSIFPSASRIQWTSSEVDGWIPALTDAFPDPAGYRVRDSMLRHGNYDYYNNDVVWDAGISERAIPDSLYHTSKPTWFGSLTWPPIDPLTHMANDIPAKARWDAYVISGNIDDLF